MRAAVLGLVLLVAAALPAAAEGMRCPVIGSQPQVEIQVINRNTALNTRKPVRELTQLSANSLGHQPLGLYMSKFSSGVQISYDLRREGDEVCLWVTKVQVQIGYDDRTIYVAKDFEKDTCEYKAILSHEAKHAVTDDSVLAEYNGRFRKNMSDAAIDGGMAGPFKRIFLDDSKQKLAEQIQKAFDRTFADFQAARARAQKTVDTPEEYGRVKRICPGGFKFDE
jgi:hypothetical protein